MDAVTDNPERHRYELRVDGELAGSVDYRLRPGVISLLHTEIDERFRRRGLASQLIAHAFDDARHRGLAVLPFCPFAKAYLAGHSEYLDLVPAERREALGV
jgi:uncharacterized protein